MTRQAHPKGERRWSLLVMLGLMGLIILSVVVFGVPDGLPSR